MQSKPHYRHDCSLFLAMFLIFLSVLMCSGKCLIDPLTMNMLYMRVIFGFYSLAYLRGELRNCVVGWCAIQFLGAACTIPCSPLQATLPTSHPSK